MSIGSHHSAAPGSTTWLTPPHILDALGGWQSFDLDPCAAPLPRPWPTAKAMNAREDANGLMIRWTGRVWLNPPYTTGEVDQWLARMAEHGSGVSLLFARTETETFHRRIWEQASGLLFLEGRLHFHIPTAPAPERCSSRGAEHEWFAYDPSKPKSLACRYCGMAKDNAGAPSVLCAYGADDLDRLAAAELDGHFVPLRFARFALVAAMDRSWAELMRDWLARQRGPVSVSDAYRYFARHPKAKANRHWREKVRQKLAYVGERIGRDSYVPAAA